MSKIGANIRKNRRLANRANDRCDKLEKDFKEALSLLSRKYENDKSFGDCPKVGPQDDFAKCCRKLVDIQNDIETFLERMLKDGDTDDEADM